MPLVNGIESYNYYGAPKFVSLPEKIWDDFLSSKDAIFAFFRNHPELLDDPYAGTSLPWNKWGGCTQEPNETSIFALLQSVGLAGHGVLAATDSSAWQEIFEGVQGLSLDTRKDLVFQYVLVDFTVYFVHLMNIFEPNRGLLLNLYATNLQKDALGRPNEVMVIRAIEKLVKKILLVNDGLDSLILSDRSSDLVQIIKLEMEKSPRTTRNDGIEFENQCGKSLRESGFEIRETPRSGDFGADLIALKDGIGYAIQCKDTTKPAGIRAVQEAAAARIHYQVDYGVVCATGGFTEAAVELASTNRVIVCTLDQLPRRLDAV